MGESSSSPSTENMGGVGTGQGVSIGIASNSSRSYSYFSSFHYLARLYLLLTPILEEDEPKNSSLPNNGIGTTDSHATKRKRFQTTTTTSYLPSLRYRTLNGHLGLSALIEAPYRECEYILGRTKRAEERSRRKRRKGMLLHGKSLLESLGSVPGADEFRLQLQ
jgi:hypothetical protein